MDYDGRINYFRIKKDMIADIFLIIVGWLLQVIIFLLPKWSIWPQTLIDGLTWFFTSLMNLNIVFPVDTLLLCISTFIIFQVYYLQAKIILKIFNYIRGAGGLDI